jgi:putative glutamine amidotransferase
MAARLVTITTRVDLHPDRGERRDGLDQRLSRLIVELGGVPVPVVNDWTAAEMLLNAIHPSAVVLSGGNDLDVVGGDAPERDRVERRILDWAAATQIPVLGICRGMQMIAVEAGARLRRSNDHVCDAHLLHGGLAGDVPSHHSWCVDDAPPGFSVLAQTEDGSCEAFLRDDKLMLGIMWHPERISPARSCDAALIKSVLRL